MANPYPWDPNDSNETRPKPAFLKNWDPNGPAVMSGPGQFRRQGSPMDESGNSFVYNIGGSQGFRSLDPSKFYAGQGRAPDPRSESQRLAGQTAEDRRYGGGWEYTLADVPPETFLHGLMTSWLPSVALFAAGGALGGSATPASYGGMALQAAKPLVKGGLSYLTDQGRPTRGGPTAAERTALTGAGVDAASAGFQGLLGEAPSASPAPMSQGFGGLTSDGGYTPPMPDSSGVGDPYKMALQLEGLRAPLSGTTRSGGLSRLMG